MFKSIYSQQWLKWNRSPKKFIVNLEVKVGEKYTFLNVEVVAISKAEAFKKAKQKVSDDIVIIVKGSKSLGKIKQLNEF